MRCIVPERQQWHNWPDSYADIRVADGDIHSGTNTDINPEINPDTHAGTHSGTYSHTFADGRLRDAGGFHLRDGHAGKFDVSPIFLSHSSLLAYEPCGAELTRHRFDQYL